MLGADAGFIERHRIGSEHWRRSHKLNTGRAAIGRELGAVEGVMHITDGDRDIAEAVVGFREVFGVVMQEVQNLRR